MSVRGLVLARLEEVAGEQDKILVPLTDDLILLEFGLDSLCIAVVVARLDEELDCDPFRHATADFVPVTVGDIISLYENAVA